MQCSNHLKQIGLAVHNFHDTQTVLPPLLVFDQDLPIYVLLYPYLEKASLYETFTAMRAANAGYTNWTGGYATNWFNSLSEENKRAHSVNTYLCPSRRAGTAYSSMRFTGANGGDPASATGGKYLTGPRNDYIAVCAKTKEDYWFRFTIFYDVDDASQSTQTWFRSPFRLPNIQWSGGVTGSATADRTKIINWTPGFDMSLWQDGSSNQVLFGEKYIPIAALNNEEVFSNVAWDGAYTAIMNDSNGWKIHRESGKLPLMGRSPSDLADYMRVKDPSANPDHAMPNNGNTWGRFGFGSNHAGICQFVLGDSSVRSFPVTVDAELLYFWADVQDGNTVSLP
jgi:hypothetical protein